MNLERPAIIYERLERKRLFLLMATLALYYIISQLFIRQFHFVDDLLYDVWVRRLWEESILFPHHPAFHLIQLALWKIFGSLIPQLTPYHVAQQLNLLVGVASGLLVFLIVWHRNRNFAGAYVGMLFLLFSYVGWFFFMGGEPYSIGMVFALLGCYYLLVVIPKREANYDYIVLGLIFALMTLLHNFAFPVILPVTVYLLVRAKRRGGGLKGLFITLSATFSLLAGFYLFTAWHLGELSSWGKFWYWLTYYSQVGIWGRPNWLSIPHSIVGLLRALYFGSYVRDFIAYRNYTWYSPLFLSLFLIIGVLTAYIIIISGRHILNKKLWSQERSFLIVGALVIFSGMTIWWYPIVVDFWIFPLAFFAVIVGDVFSRLERFWLKFPFYIYIFLLFFANFTGEIYPNSPFAKHPSPQRELAYALIKLGVADDDLIYTGLEAVDYEIAYITEMEIEPTSFPLDTVIVEGADWEENNSFIEFQLKGRWQKRQRVFITEDQITPYEPIIFYLMKAHNHYVKDFLDTYGQYLHGSGYTFWQDGEEDEIFIIDLEGYFATKYDSVPR